jgi:hypothetical protein
LLGIWGDRTIYMQRGEHEGMHGGDSGQQQRSGQARLSKPHDVARQYAGGDKNIIAGPV